MSITTRAELFTAIESWMARPNDTIIQAIEQDCVRLVEDALAFGYGAGPQDPLYLPPLRIEDMLVRATASLSGEYVAVPTDFLEVRGPMKVNESPEVKIEYVTPDQFAATAASYSTASAPKVFTIAGSEFRFGPTPSGGTAELWYYGKIPALTASNTTNWLLTKAPSVYLFGGLWQAYTFTSEDAQSSDAIRFFKMFQAQVTALQAQDKRRKYGSAPLVMRSVSPTP